MSFEITLLRSLYEERMSAHMTPLEETALGNGNLHTYLKILFIRRKLFYISLQPLLDAAAQRPQPTASAARSSKKIELLPSIRYKFGVRLLITVITGCEQFVTRKDILILAPFDIASAFLRLHSTKYNIFFQ